jgi:hypothetical protein
MQQAKPLPSIVAKLSFLDCYARAKSARAKQAGAGPKAKATARPPLPDPKIAHGPYRPFTLDPGWSEDIAGEEMSWGQHFFH